MLTIRHITTASEYYSFVENLLESAFPKEECRDKKLQRECTDNNPKFKCNLIQTTYGQPIGVITRWDFGDFIYIEHFAIEQEERRHGYGSEALSKLLKMEGKRAILEVEMPYYPNDAAMKRIQFYKRLGFQLRRIPYKQPPYRKGDEWLPMKLMTYGKLNVTNRVINTIYHEVYKTELLK